MAIVGGLELVDVVSFFQNIPLWLLVVVVAWSMIWMGLGMWKAARKKHLVWFIFFLLVHTIGILEILYIFVFSEIGKKTVKTVKPAGPITKKRAR